MIEPDISGGMKLSESTVIILMTKFLLAKY